MSSAEEAVNGEVSVSQDVDTSCSPISQSEEIRELLITKSEVVLQQLIPSSGSRKVDTNIDWYAYETEEGAMPVPAWYLAMHPSKDMNGWSYVLWWFIWKMFGILHVYRLKPRNKNPHNSNAKVLKNKRARMPYYFGSKRRAIAACRWYIRDVREQLIGTIGDVGRKGGIFKTGLMLWLGAVFATATQNQCGVVDFDSTANKAMYQRAGRPEHYNDLEVNAHYDPNNKAYDLNILINLILNHQWRPTAREIRAYFAQHVQSGLYMTSPTNPTYMTEGEAIIVLETLMAQFPLCFVDTSPGEKEVNTTSVVQICNVLHLIDEDNIEGFNRISAHRSFLNRTTNNSFDNGLKAGTHFIVVGQVPMERYNMRYRYALARHLNVDASQLVLIPEDTYIRESKTLDFGGPSIHFMLAIWTHAVQVADRIVRYNAEHPQPKPSLGTPDGSHVPDEQQQKVAADTLLRALGSPTAAANFIKEVNRLNKERA